MTCKNCGTELPESSKFCTKCGTPTSAEDTDISAAGVERAVPKGFSVKKNIIIIIIAAILLIGGGITAIAVVNSHSASSGVADKLQLAERYLNEQNYEQAIIEYQKVLVIEPMNVDAYLGLADAYLGMGDTDKALEWLNKGLELTRDARIQKKLDSQIKSESSSDETSSSDNSSSNNSYVWENTASDVFGVDIRQIHNATSIRSLGRGVYFYISDNGSGFVRIDEDRFAKTGELSYVDIKVEGFNATDCDYPYTATDFDEGDFITMHKANDANRLAIRYDEANNEISKLCEMINRDGQLVTTRGYTVSAKVRRNGDEASIVVTATRADGSAFENVFEDCHPHYLDYYLEDGADYTIYTIVNSPKYLYCINFDTGEDGVLEYVVDCDGNASLLSTANYTKKDSEFDTWLWREDMSAGVAYLAGIADTGVIMFSSNNEDEVYRYYCLSGSSGDWFQNHTARDIRMFDFLKDKSISSWSISLQFNGAVGNHAVMGYGDGNSDLRYVLFDYKNNITLSKEYRYISKRDRDTYLVQRDDGKWGYIDSDCNELGFFDDAANFKGDYTVVVEKGKGYFVDKNMNKVSEGFNIDRSSTANGRVFTASYGEQNLLIIKKES